MEHKKIKYKVIRRKIKYPRLELKTGNLVIVAPYGIKVKPIIARHKNWILNKINFINRTLEEIQNKKLVKRSEKVFKDLIRKYVRNAEEFLKVKPKKVYFRRMKTKWASCSGRKNITLNPILKYLPRDLIEYIIFHEFCHLLIPYHNKKFWLLVSKKFNNPEKFEKTLQLLVFNSEKC